MKAFRADPSSRNTPIIFLTNLSELDTISDALDADVSGYIVKSDWSIEDIVESGEIDWGWRRFLKLKFEISILHLKYGLAHRAYSDTPYWNFARVAWARRRCRNLLYKIVARREIDPTESGFLQVTYRIMRIALVLLVLSGLDFLFLYRLPRLEDRLYSPLIWAKLSIVILILINAILLQTRRIPMWQRIFVRFMVWRNASYAASQGNNASFVS